MSEHTPTPWINSGNRIYMGAAVERREIAVATKSDPTIRYAAEANAAFIARAVNAHYDLVAALHAAMDDRPGWYDLAQAALAKAKA